MSAFEDLKDVSAASLAKLNDMLRYLYKKVQGGITKAELAPELVDDIDTVDREKLEAGAVTADKIEDEAIASYHVQDAAITNAKIDRASVDRLVVVTADIKDGAIMNAQIGELAVDTANIAALAVTTGKIANLAVDTAQIKDGAISTVKIGEEQVTTSKIGNAQITSAKIGTLQVTGAHIDNATIDSSKIISIDTSVVNIASADGKMAIIGPTQVVKDASNNVRVAMGDILGDGTKYGLAVYGTDGTTALFNENGITPNGIPAQAVDTDKLADRAIKYGKMDQTTADLTLEVGPGKQYTTLYKALEAIPYIVNHYIDVVLYPGTTPYMSSQLVNHIGKGGITIRANFGDTVRVHGISATDVTCSLHIWNLTIMNSVQFGYCPYAWVSGIISTDAYDFGIFAGYAANVLVTDCTFSNKTQAISAVWPGAIVRADDVTGTGNTEAIHCEWGGIVFASETVTLSGTRTIYEQGLIIGPAGAQPSGADGFYVTGTRGTANNLLKWNADGDAIDAGVSLSGASNKAITGTPGASGNLAAWNADGDLVDSGIPPITNFAKTILDDTSDAAMRATIGAAASTQMSFTQSGVSYNNSWADYGGSFAFGYMKDSLGFVHLRGLLTGGTTTSGTVMANLPANYRPVSQTQYFPVACNAASYAPGVVSINGANGNITLYSGSGWVSFNGITFYAG